jgi:hypothetical protein
VPLSPFRVGRYVAVLLSASAVASACDEHKPKPLGGDAGVPPTPPIDAASMPPLDSSVPSDASVPGDAQSALDADASDAGPSQTGYAAAVLADAPLVYYRLDEDAGPTAKNRATSGAAFDARYNNFDAGSFRRPGLVAGDASTAVLCSGPTDPTSISLPLAGPTDALKLPGGFTIEAWVTRTLPGADTRAIVSTKGSGKDGYSFGIANDHLFLASHGTANVPSKLQVPADAKAHYVAVVFDGTSKFTFYRDAASELVDVGAAAAPTYLTTTDFSICAFPTPNGIQFFRWNGVVDEVAVYATALTPARIAAHRGAGAPDAGG